jgi:copper homeostasis protein
MRTLHEELQIPVFPIIRPRDGDFVYNEEEFATMKRDISFAREVGMHGVVCGILLRNRSVDVRRTIELVEWARPLEVTFHRAFDQTNDLFQALEDVIRTGATRILTSGGAAIVPQGIATLQKLVSAAANRLVIMPGSGLDRTNIARVAAETRAKEFHSGLSAVIPYGSSDLRRFEAEIHAMKRLLFETACSA